MNLIVKPLTPDPTPAYLDFFDNRAFSDNNPMEPCGDEKKLEARGTL